MRDAPAASAITLRSLGALASPPGSLPIALVGCPYGALASIVGAAGTVRLATVAAGADKELRTTSTAEKVADGGLTHRCSATTEPRDTRAIPMLVYGYARIRTGCEARHLGKTGLFVPMPRLVFWSFAPAFCRRRRSPQLLVWAWTANARLSTACGS